MNKKIYFNNQFILIAEGNIQPAENQVIVHADQLSDLDLNSILEKFIQQSDKNNLILSCKNVNEVTEHIKKHFVFIEAAGGLIKKESSYLLIHRHGKWDLPKGKLDKGETTEHAAIRE